MSRQSLSSAYRPLSGFSPLPSDPVAPELLLPMPLPDGIDGRDMWYTGGELSSTTLTASYRQGFFPWQGEPLGWCSPDPRFVIWPDSWHVPRSLRRIIKKSRWRISWNADPAAVVRSCMTVARSGESGTWLTQEMVDAYSELAIHGYMQSGEIWNEEGLLIGGLYGVLVGTVFVGDSMFSAAANASKLAFARCAEHLWQAGVTMIDCQVYSDHLAQFGAVEISRASYLHHLRQQRDVELLDARRLFHF